VKILVEIRMKTYLGGKEAEPSFAQAQSFPHPGAKIVPILNFENFLKFSRI